MRRTSTEVCTTITTIDNKFLIKRKRYTHRYMPYHMVLVCAYEGSSQQFVSLIKKFCFYVNIGRTYMPHDLGIFVYDTDETKYRSYFTWVVYIREYEHISCSNSTGICVPASYSCTPQKRNTNNNNARRYEIKFRSLVACRD